MEILKMIVIGLVSGKNLLLVSGGLVHAANAFMCED
jgi:hypothetical protein